MSPDEHKRHNAKYINSNMTSTRVNNGATNFLNSEIANFSQFLPSKSSLFGHVTQRQ